MDKEVSGDVCFPFFKFICEVQKKCKKGARNLCLINHDDDDC